MAKFNVTGEQHFSISGQILEIQRQIRLKGGSPIDPELVQLALQDIIEGKFIHIKKDNSILCLVLIGKSIIIDDCDGSETLANANEIFKVGIDEDFENYGINNPGNATEKTVVVVHKMVKDATSAQMFGLFGTDLDKLCLTQHQIKNFCKKHSNWLRADGYATLFLFKVRDRFFVADVRVSFDGLRVDVDKFKNGYVWSAENAHRVVVPQLIV